MLRALWFLIKLGLFIAAALWVAARPGEVTINWLGYDIRIDVGFALLLGLGLLFLFAAILQVLALPSLWRNRRSHRRHEQGMQAVVRNLSALAAGDVRAAEKNLKKIRATLPGKNGLTLLLESQTARLSGDSMRAHQGFKKMLAHKDTAFLGLRALISESLEQKDYDATLILARQALAHHKKQGWLLQLVYRLELKAGLWAAAEKTLKRALKHKAFESQIVRNDQTVLWLCRGDKALERGDKHGALTLYKKAHKAEPGFVPATLRLAEYYKQARKRRLAVAAIEQTWRRTPHPELAALWAELAPKNKPHDSAARLRWAERLITIAPDEHAAEGHLATAKAALNDGLWGEAEHHLKEAEKTAPSARLYRLWAQLSEAQRRSDDAVIYWGKAAQAPAGKVWHCKKSGQIFEHWQARTLPQGLFNTVVWGLPNVEALSQNQDIGTARWDAYSSGLSLPVDI